MLLKWCANINGLEKEMYFAMGAMLMAEAFISGRRPTITSGLDSHENRPKSKHNIGFAVDIRTYDKSKEDVDDIFYALRNYLDPRGFDTVLEKDHIHVEFDPKSEESIFEKLT